MKLSENVREFIICPVTGSKPLINEHTLVIKGEDETITYPILDGIPALLDESSSIFSIGELKNQYEARVNLQGSPAPSFFQKAKSAINKSFLPSISNNVKAKENYKKFIELIITQSSNPVILVVGGGSLGEGMQELVDRKSVEIVEGDIYFGPRTNIIFDAHQIPFKDGTFDAVIIQAVLEHVADPYRCVDEIHRVLKDTGIVYAETPFMQQVHMGANDFTRFTGLGHRRLFRKFREIERGAMCGPGMALSWAYCYFLRSFNNSWFGWSVLYRFGRLTSFFLKYFDYYLIEKPGAEDAASGVYFMGQRSNEVLSDRELIKQYRGAQ